MNSGDATAPSADELAFVEDFALGMERQGLFRMAGRVLGWLLISDPPEQTAGQLAAALQASKGSISAAMKFLIPTGMVERQPRPGQRRDYYAMPAHVWADLVRRQSVQYGQFRSIIERGLALLEGAPAARRVRLQELHDLYDWLDREMPALWERWDRERGSAS